MTVAKILGVTFKTLFPNTTRRLVKLDKLKQEIARFSILSARFPAGYAPQLASLTAEYNANRFWWMKLL